MVSESWLSSFRQKSAGLKGNCDPHGLNLADALPTKLQGLAGGPAARRNDCDRWDTDGFHAMAS